MSHYNDFETEMTDTEALIRALCRCSNRENCPIKREYIEVHNEPQSLYGYRGDRREQVAHVIIRRQHVGGAANDIGFLRNGDGTYQAIISDYDKMFYDKKWLGKLTTYYNVEKSKMELEVRGINYTETLDTNGRIQLRAKFKVSNSTSRIQVRR